MRSTELLVEASVAIHRFDTGETEYVQVFDVPCTWVWDDGSRESAEYWAVVKYIYDNHMRTNDTISITYWAGTPVKSGENQ